MRQKHLLVLCWILFLPQFKQTAIQLPDSPAEAFTVENLSVLLWACYSSHKKTNTWKLINPKLQFQINKIITHTKTSKTDHVIYYENHSISWYPSIYEAIQWKRKKIMFFITNEKMSIHIPNQKLIHPIRK